jgi:hypothetical protein
LHDAARLVHGLPELVHGTGELRGDGTRARLAPRFEVNALSAVKNAHLHGVGIGGHGDPFLRTGIRSFDPSKA